MNVAGLGSMLETVIAISDVELMCISETSGLDWVDYNGVILFDGFWKGTDGYL